ncbi:hypothetical protein BHE90_002671 [Fusarium euwallaceae]|uniref:Uncharacterized protein n=1 Tax=Fusarium euwallaceae TaxID=1147111 RepID=A0A430M465_9HYPO|nr:hypothetical protein BHE90_002671 [Fusarium euwallaceae]
MSDSTGGQYRLPDLTPPGSSCAVDEALGDLVDNGKRFSTVVMEVPSHFRDLPRGKPEELPESLQEREIEQPTPNILRPGQTFWKLSEMLCWMD